MCFQQHSQVLFLKFLEANLLQFLCTIVLKFSQDMPESPKVINLHPKKGKGMILDTVYIKEYLRALRGFT